MSCRECGEAVILGVRPTTKGMISEFTVNCTVCKDSKSTNTPNLIRERKRKREKIGALLHKTENINYAHVAAFLDNGLGYSGLRHYCKYFNARCLNEATFIVYARQVIQDVILDTEENLQCNARIVRRAFQTQLEADQIIDLTVAYTTTYHQWGSDFCLVGGAVIELQTGLVLDYDVANMYCHVCKINSRKIVTMTPAEMTNWFTKHQDTCEIKEWCDELDHDAEEGVKEIEPKYLECFIAKKIWCRSVDKLGFRYTTLIHESDEKIHSELLRSAPYGDMPVLIDSMTSCFSRRKSEHARTSFQAKLKSKCPRERVQTKDRIMYVYAMSIPEYNRFAVGSNIKLRELVRRMEEEEEAANEVMTLEVAEIIPVMHNSGMIEQDKIEVVTGDESAQEVEYENEEEEMTEQSELVSGDVIEGIEIEEAEEEIIDGYEETEEILEKSVKEEKESSNQKIIITSGITQNEQPPLRSSKGRSIKVTVK